MKIGEAVAQLQAVAARIPGGMDAEIEVWVCDGASVVTCSVFEIDHAATVDRDGRARDSHGLINVHPHRDPHSERHRAPAESADEQLQRWTDEQ